MRRLNPDLEYIGTGDYVAIMVSDDSGDYTDFHVAENLAIELVEAKKEIERLKEFEWMYKDLCKDIKDLCK